MGQAARLFNGEAVSTLHGRITPSDEQREFLQTQWNELADHLRPKLYERSGYRVSTWIQGSYKFGTLIKPVHLGEEYDVDLGVYFEWEKDGEAEPAAKQLRDWVQAEVVDYSRMNQAVRRVDPPKERCSRLIYQKQFHIDTPVYHLEPSNDKRQLACLSDVWEDSDPKAIYVWFRDSVPEDQRPQLRRLVRYIKAWAAIAFEQSPKSRPSSICLTVAVASACQSTNISEKADDDALAAIVEALYNRLSSDRRVPNPVSETEDLNQIEEQAWETFMTQLSVLHDSAEKASLCEDEASAALAWAQAFSFLMPLPETQQVEMVEEQTGRALMQLPEIDIEVYRRNPRQLLGRYKNEVPSVTKNCDLVFTIVNPEIVPAYSVVEWTVRNSGTEADTIGDLGHKRLGTRLLKADEHTAYSGTHFMDCIVHLNGQVYAVRRVPVTVRDVAYPARNPPRPAWTKVRSLVRRRR